MPKVKTLNVLNMELLYNIAQEIGMLGDEFSNMLTELSSGTNLDEWCVIVQENIEDEDKVEAFYHMLGREYFRKYSINIHMETKEDLQMVYDKIESALESIGYNVMHIEAVEQ